MDPLQEELLARARAARGNAYARYSDYAVGAAVRTSEGGVFTGANIESAVYGLTLCAERVAIACAVSSGHRDITSMAVVASGRDVSPCGACLQFLSEFASPDATIITAGSEGEPSVVSLADLLPKPFRL